MKRLRVIIPGEEKQTEIVNHITEIRSNAKRLQREANTIVEEAKEKVEHILLSEHRTNLIRMVHDGIFVLPSSCLQNEDC